jgi:hypothetical protein
MAFSVNTLTEFLKNEGKHELTKWQTEGQRRNSSQLLAEIISHRCHQAFSGGFHALADDIHRAWCPSIF